MRVLHCITSLEMGGAERQVGILAAAQAAAGHAVHVASVRGGANVRVLQEAGVATHLLPVSGNTDPALVTGLLRLLRVVRPDLVQTWLTQMDVAAGLAARLARRPWLIAERSSAGAYPPGWKHRLRSALGRGASAIVANSTGGEAYWRALAPRVPRWIIGNAVPLEQIRAARPAEAPARTVLFVGRLSAEKRVATLIRGIAAANGSSAATLLLCGEGPERPALQKLVAGLGLGERVQFLGIRSDVWSLMHAAAVVVNPSVFEGCPNTVLEAMAAGRPLVVSDIPAHRELLDERAAWLVDPEDSAAFAAALEEVLACPAEAARRSTEASRRVEAFSVPCIVEQYEVAYRSVVAARGRQGRG